MGSMLRLLLALLIADAGSGAGARAAEPLAVARIADGVYVHVAPYELANPANGGDIGNCGFIVGERSVAVIDSCGSLLVGQRLLASIRAVTDRPIAFLVNTHVHPDHLLGNAAFAGTGARIVGNARLPDALAARADAYLAATRRLSAMLPSPAPASCRRTFLSMAAWNSTLAAARSWQRPGRRPIPTAISPSSTARPAPGSSAISCSPTTCRHSTAA